MPMVSLAILLAVGEAGAELSPEEFRDSIKPAFVRFARAVYERVDHQEQHGQTPGAPSTSKARAADDFADAWRTFEETVSAHWPRKLATPGDLPPERWGPPGIRRDAHPVSEATKALREARRFRSEEYVGGTATREEAVARFLAVADNFPGTAEHDEALFMAGKLYTQTLMHGAQRDPNSALRLWKKLAEKQGLLTGYSLMAEEEVASYQKARRDRIKAKSDLQLSLQSRQDPEWLSNQLLVPTDSAPKGFIKRVSGVLFQIRGIQHTNAVNMVADAFYSEDPLGNLKWLKERHPHDELVQREVERAIQNVTSRTPALRKGSDADVLLPSAVAAVARAAERAARKGLAHRPAHDENRVARLTERPVPHQPPKKRPMAASLPATQQASKEGGKAQGRPTLPDQRRMRSREERKGLHHRADGRAAGETDKGTLTADGLVGYLPAVLLSISVILLGMVLWRRYRRGSA